MGASHLLIGRLQGVVPPILQRFIAFAIRVLLCLLLLSQMALAVGHNTAHMVNVRVLVVGWSPAGIVLEDLHDLPTTGSSYQSSIHAVEGNLWTNLSWPTVSPELESPVHPEDWDCSFWSQSRSSAGVMFTISLNSLKACQHGARHGQRADLPDHSVLILYHDDFPWCLACAQCGSSVEDISEVRDSAFLVQTWKLKI